MPCGHDRIVPEFQHTGRDMLSEGKQERISPHRRRALSAGPRSWQHTGWPTRPRPTAAQTFLGRRVVADGFVKPSYEEGGCGCRCTPHSETCDAALHQSNTLARGQKFIPAATVLQ